jgi:hypothetical protein
MPSHINTNTNTQHPAHKDLQATSKAHPQGPTALPPRASCFFFFCSPACCLLLAACSAFFFAGAFGFRSSRALGCAEEGGGAAGVRAFAPRGPQSPPPAPPLATAATALAPDMQGQGQHTQRHPGDRSPPPPPLNKDIYHTLAHAFTCRRYAPPHQHQSA